MDILFATTNKNKVDRIKKLIKDTDINLISLAELDYQIEEPEENGKDGVENAIIKAKYYYNQLKNKIPVLAQDDTLFLKDIDESDNPKKDIKLPVIKKYGQFTDEFAYKYYTDLIKKYNRDFLEMEFHYGHAICDFGFIEGSESVLPGKLHIEINSRQTPGYFLADMMKVKTDGGWKYYSDLTDDELIKQDKDIKRSLNSLLEKLKLLI